jgi:hypothetical protein
MLQVQLTQLPAVIKIPVILLFAEFAVMDLTALNIYPVQLKNPLCNIQSVCRNIHHSPSLRLWKAHIITTWAPRCR